MKLRKKFKITSTALLLSIALCLFYSSASLASTTIYFEQEGLPGIGGFQFNILPPTTGEFKTTLDDNDVWSILPIPQDSTLIFGVDNTMVNDLPSGEVGTFEENVDLGNWGLSDQAGNDLFEVDDDFTVLFSTIELPDGSTMNNYTIKAVPLPSALILLGSGLAGMVGIRRRQMRN